MAMPFVPFGVGHPRALVSTGLADIALAANFAAHHRAKLLICQSYAANKRLHERTSTYPMGLAEYAAASPASPPSATTWVQVARAMMHVPSEMTSLSVAVQYAATTTRQTTYVRLIVDDTAGGVTRQTWTHQVNQLASSGDDSAKEGVVALQDPQTGEWRAEDPKEVERRSTYLEFHGSCTPTILFRPTERMTIPTISVWPEIRVEMKALEDSGARVPIAPVGVWVWGHVDG